MIIIGCNAQSFYLKHELIEYLEELKFDYLDVSGFGDEDIYDTSMKVIAGDYSVWNLVSLVGSFFVHLHWVLGCFG